MKVPAEFDSIRPYEPEELPQAFGRLLADGQFRQVLAYVLPGVPLEEIRAKMLSCKTNLEFQKKFCYGFVQSLIDKLTTGCDMDAAAIDTAGRYTFVSNHRDIVLDSGFLDKLLIDCGFATTCEIAIGDNLLSLPWVKDLVRVNKSFIVRRGLPPRETLSASRLMSDYMHYVIDTKRDNIWIAQREGRAKDSDDITQPAILKMMAMGGGTGSIADRLRRMHIVPLAISYEYDPCDYLKAREFQLRRDNPAWRKTAADDVESMKTGITGYKGHVSYCCAPCMDDWLGSLSCDMPKAELFGTIARHIDREIHRSYRLYPSNYIALDMLNGTAAHAARYTAAGKTAFTDYLNSRLNLISLPHKDDDYLMERLLTMYANPAVNYLKAIS